MGSITNVARGQRFIAEFGTDLANKLAPPGLGARCTLALDARQEVQLFTTVQDVFGHSHDVMFDRADPLFDADDSYQFDPGLLTQLAGWLGQPEDEVESRLRRANLWGE